MGIRSFGSFLNEHVPESIESFNARNIDSIAIDVSVYVQQFFISANGNSGICVARFAKLYEHFSLRGIRVLFVFDGPPSVAKNRQLVIRAKKRIKTNKTFAKQLFFVDLAKELSSKGYLCLQAVGDAEKACAWLCKKGLVSTVLSEDFDTLAYGSPRMVRFNNGNFQEVRVSVILSKLCWTHNMFLYFCILSCCDFSQVAFGPTVALALMRTGEYKTFLPHMLEALN